MGVFPVSMHSVQRGLIINSCNFIADWTIVLGRYLLQASQFTTTDLPDQPGPDFIFTKSTFGKKSVFQGSFHHFWFSKWPFPHYNEAEDTVLCHTCMKMFKEKKNKTYTKADPTFVSSVYEQTGDQSYLKSKCYCQLLCNNYNNRIFELT